MRSLSLLAALGLLASAALGQVTFTSSFGLPPGQPEISYLPTASYPNGASPAPTTGAPLPNAATLPGPVGNLAGGMASDDRNAWIYTTNGNLMTMDMNPHFVPFGFTAGAPFAGPLPIPLPFTALTPVTGLAFDDQNNILWACTQNAFWGMNPLPPFNAVVPPQPIPGLANPATGLGFESSTGSLFACDAAGGLYNFTLGGAPIGLQPVAITATVGVPLGGLAVGTHNGPGSIPAPACSTQIAGYHITVTDGFNLYDATNAAPAIPMGASPVAGGAYGHTYSSDYQVRRCDNAIITPTPLPVLCSSGTFPLTGLQQPAITGPGAFNGIRLVGAPPSTPAFLLIDTCPQLPCWNGLMMNPFTWTSIPFTTDAAGNAGIGFFAGGFPPGFQFSHQWAIQDTLAPLGYCFSNLSTETIGLP